MKRGVVFSIACLSVLQGCASTLVIKSNPSQADVKLLKSGVSGRTDSVIRLPPGVFGGATQITETLLLQKPGYRDVSLPVTLRRGAKNKTKPEIVGLDRLDTTLVIMSEPSGAFITFSLPADQLPIDWKPGFRTPTELLCTADEAEGLVASRLGMKTVEMEGYERLPVGDGRPGPIRLAPGEKTTLVVPLRPTITTLKVNTAPQGAFVEDTADGGFGYLGETPVTRNFTWEDVAVWADKKNIRTFSAVSVTLRISKSGFRDIVSKVSIPVGEERSYVRALQPLAERIHFTSDPPGASVFVERSRDEGNKPSSYLETLGTTPVTRAIEPADPFRPGDRFVYRKSGFAEVVIEFVEDDYSYHVVLEPTIHPAPRP